MKPHLKLVHGMWHCGIRGTRECVPGFDMFHAYVEWVTAQYRKAGV